VPGIKLRVNCTCVFSKKDLSDRIVKILCETFQLDCHPKVMGKIFGSFTGEKSAIRLFLPDECGTSYECSFLVDLGTTYENTRAELLAPADAFKCVYLVLRGDDDLLCDFLICSCNFYEFKILPIIYRDDIN